MKNILIFQYLFLALFCISIYPQWEMIKSPPLTPEIVKVANHPDGFLIAITKEKEVFHSTPDRTIWQKISTIEDEAKKLAISPSGIIYIGIVRGYLVSFDNGVTWTKKILFSNASYTSDIEFLTCGYLIMSQASQWYPEYNRIWISTDNGSNWNITSSGLNGSELVGLTKDLAENIYLITRGGSIFKSIDNAYTWQFLANLSYSSFYIETDPEDNLFAATSDYIFKSTDLGNTWNIVLNKWTYNIFIDSNNYIYAHNTRDLMFSSDNGYSWLNLGLSGTAINDVIVISDTLFVGTGTSSIINNLRTFGLIKSSNLGNNWDVCFRYNDKFIGIRDFISAENTMVATGPDGLYLYQNSKNKWDTLMVINMNLLKMSSARNLYVSSATSSSNPSTGLLYRSQDDGITWTLCEGISRIRNFFINESEDIFAVSWQAFKSSDYGVSWDTIFFGQPNISFISNIAQNSSGSIFISTYHSFYMPGFGYVITTLFMRTDNDGSSWSQIRNDLNVSYIHFIDSTMYLATANMGIYKSNDYGLNVTAINNGLTSLNVKKIISTPHGILICVTGNGIFRSLDNGNSWSRLDHSGLFSAEINSIYYDDKAVLYAATNNGIGAFIGDLLVSVDDDQITLVPNNFLLYQNYPNPFNPITVIRYDIAQAENVEISIYNILGQRIRTLVNEIKQPGQYDVSFDASSLTSGIYIYRIKSGNYLSSKKMLLIK